MKQKNFYIVVDCNPFDKELALATAMETASCPLSGTELEEYFDGELTYEELTEDISDFEKEELQDYFELRDYYKRELDELFVSCKDFDVDLDELGDADEYQTTLETEIYSISVYVRKAGYKFNGMEVITVSFGSVR